MSLGQVLLDSSLMAKRLTPEPTHATSGTGSTTVDPCLISY